MQGIYKRNYLVVSLASLEVLFTIFLVLGFFLELLFFTYLRALVLPRSALQSPDETEVKLSVSLQQSEQLQVSQQSEQEQSVESLSVTRFSGNIDFNEFDLY